MDEIVIAPPRRAWVNGVLFALTLLSTWYVGLGLSLSYLHPEIMGGPSADIASPAALRDPQVLVLSLLFAAVLMIILTAHELGHYLTCRRNGLDATLPYFIPFPNLLGTLGAFIKIRSRIQWKRQLFDVGAAGPLAGFILALPAIIVGLAFSKVVAVQPGEGVLSLGEPLLFKLAGLLFFRRIPPGADLVLHPVAFAGWAGLLVTSLNLFPVGQLDGGHIAYALVGRRRGLVSMAALVAFVVLGVFFFVGWLLWGGIGVLYVIILRMRRPAGIYRLACRLKHPPVIDEDAHLGRGRTVLAILIIVIFVLSFIPDPIKGSSLLALLKHAGSVVK
jgi:membrane-associated protease RseP (regulator of RpoE activity)